MFPLPIPYSFAPASGYTAHWLVHLASGWGSDPTGAQIRAGNLGSGSPASFSGTEDCPDTGTGTITEATAITGLTPGTVYRLAWVVYDAVSATYTNVVVSDVVTHGVGSIVEASAAADVQLAGAALDGIVIETAATADLNSALESWIGEIVESAAAAESFVAAINDFAAAVESATAVDVQSCGFVSTGGTYTPAPLLFVSVSREAIFISVSRDNTHISTARDAQFVSSGQEG